MSDVQTFLGTTLVHTTPGFRANSVQQAYAASMEAALAQGIGAIHFIEAGTGVGKSLAYLIAAARWQADAGHGVRRKVVISTHSRALQRQLASHANVEIVNEFRRMIGATPLSVQVVMGRANYVSPDHVAWALDAGPDATALPDAAADTSRSPAERELAQWAHAHPDGCLLDLEPDSLPDGITTDTICLTHNDPAPAHLAQAKSGADVLIVNHALTVRDLMGYSVGLSLAEPDDQTLLIFDEAEHVPDVADNAQSTGLAISGVMYAARRLGYRKTAARWTQLFDDLRKPGMAARAELLSQAGHEQGLYDALVALTRTRAVDSDASPDHALWNDIRERARTLARRIRHDAIGLTMSYSRKQGYPSINCKATAGGAVVRNGLDNRITLLTSATMSDMQPSTGAASFNYLRTRLLLAADDARIGVQATHEPRSFGDLSFRVAQDMPRPLIEGDDEQFWLSPAYARQAVAETLTPTPGRTLLLCASYRDVQVLDEYWPDGQRSRVVMPPQGSALDRVAAGLARDAIMVTPAGWEGLSPQRQGVPFWSRVVLLRTPQQPDDPAARLAMAHSMHERRGDSWARARNIANRTLQQQARTKAMHKLRQGIGRSLRHPDDSVEIVILDPRLVGRSGQTGVINGMARAIPARFHGAFLDAARADKQPLLVV